MRLRTRQSLIRSDDTSRRLALYGSVSGFTCSKVSATSASRSSGVSEYVSLRFKRWSSPLPISSASFASALVRESGLEPASLAGKRLTFALRRMTPQRFEFFTLKDEKKTCAETSQLVPYSQADSNRTP